MNETQDNDSGILAAAEGNLHPYEPPRIVWREPYEPIACAVSCAHQVGNLSCIPIIT